MGILVVCCILLGPGIGWLLHAYSVDLKLRRLTAAELRSLEARLEIARRAAAFDGGSAGAVVGLVSWMKNHAVKILAKAGRQLETARGLLPAEPREAARVKREIELGLAALDILADFSQRYLEPMAVLQRQGVDQALREISGLRQRLCQRIDRHRRSFDLAEEGRQLDLLGRYIDKELGETGPADTAALFRRLSTQLRALNEIESRLNSKVDGIRSAAT